ncbi:copper chaperone, partial [Cymbomonas tetramitiformis]|eukprot:gene10047-11889_t
MAGMEPPKAPPILEGMDEEQASLRSPVVGNIPPRGSPPKGPNNARLLFRRVVRTLANLKLAVAELAGIAFLSAVGTVIEQNKSFKFYIDNYPEEPKVLGFVDYKFILDFGLDHLYSTPYFLGLVALLAASLAACSSTTQWPMVKVARNWSFLDSRKKFLRLPIAEEVDDADISSIAPLLGKQGYQVFMSKSKLYAFKGLAGRLAPIGVHASLLFVLFGTSYSALACLNGSTMTPQGGDFEVESTLSGSALAGRPDLNGLRVRVNKFDVEYLPSGAVSQFFSDLSVTDDQGNDLYRKTIS